MKLWHRIRTNPLTYAQYVQVGLYTGVTGVLLAIAVYASAEIRRADSIPHQIVSVQDVDCGEFATWQEAQSLFSEHPADVHGLDGDRDGIPCEGLMP